ncbi:helix-turn-helix domain-containing protein [Paenibacillus sp. GCM10027626]|uniref:helix-turn-helix domain-containing protein n=1 Tax=Paenibacillus sp. GCM10027626 TaxID=3273411 RepID=UPI00362CE747
MNFVMTELQQIIIVERLVSLHYFEFSKDYIFKGEKHHFWEFLYVDKGEVEVMADTEGYQLKQGDIIFHQPDEFHSVWANRQIAPNLIVISFECHSPAMNFFRKKIFPLDPQQRELLTQIVRNGLLAFQPPFDDPGEHSLHRQPDAPQGTEQLIKIYLELLLISLIRHGDAARPAQRLSFAAKERSEQDLIAEMLRFMEQHVEEEVSLEQICRQFNLSRSYASQLFRERTGLSIMKQFKLLKIAKAKTLIREEQHNFSQIAEILNYSSVHNFSRHFKAVTDMSPSEYAKSVKAMLQ